MALTDALTNPERFLMITLREVNFGERRGFPLGVEFACYTLGIALDLLGLFQLAGWYHRYGVSIAEKLQLHYALGTAYNGLQLHELNGGAPGLGLEHRQRSIQASKQTGDIVLLALPASLLAWTLASR